MKNRDIAVARIIKLCKEKKYKRETTLLAINIFDRYAALEGAEIILSDREETILLLVTSIILAAKNEQPLSPSINRLISLLAPEERSMITKAKVIDYESDILMTLGFDFNFCNSLTFMERFLRLLGHEKDAKLEGIAYEVCLFAHSRAQFLSYRPSQLAAAAIPIALHFKGRKQGGHP